MAKVDNIIKNVREFMKDNDISKYRMSIEAGLHENTLSKVFEPCFNPTAVTLRKCESAIKKIRKSLK